MRIIAGAFKGRRLLPPPEGVAVRPTSDRVKEALFSILGPPRREDGAPFRVLDLYCGTGALALEALSRGADEAVLVEQDRRVASVAEENVALVGASSRARVVRSEVGMALRGLSGRFDWVFLDPPYADGALDRGLRLLSTSAVDAALVIAEHDVKNEPAEAYGRYALENRRSWGDTAVSLYVATAGEVGGGSGRGTGTGTGTGAE